ncbi:MAG: chorismate synthase [Bdellovibrionaceae bacterium]|nr:chorismate synthase [Pseudobdellovibrionaceae bacterium]
MSDANTFGKYFRWTTFGESHGTALGVVIDGCPAGVVWNESLLRTQMNRRRPGQVDAVSKDVLVTDRNEDDRVEVLSGVFEGKTLGTPIACVVYNKNQKSQDYDKIKSSPRVGHADDVWKNKFDHVDHRGGGRSSARETLARVIAGTVAQMFLQTRYAEMHVASFVAQMGPLQLSKNALVNWSQQWKKTNAVDAFTARFPHEASAQVQELLQTAKATGNSYGGLIETWISGAPAGLGEPVFEKLKSKLAYAMMSIGATCSFEIGQGKDLIALAGQDVHTSTDSENYGGIRGGISTGDRITFKVGFKPPSTIGENAKEGRHDPCVLPRAIPIIESMAWAVLADLELASKNNKA